MAETARFTPWTGSMPQQAPLGSTGINYAGGSQTFNEMAQPSTPMTPAPAGPRFTPYTGGSAGGGLGGQISGGPSPGVADAIGGALGNIKTGTSAIGGANELGGNFLGGLGPILGGLGGVLGMATGGLGINKAIQTGNAPLGITSGAGILGGAAALGSTGALGAGGTAAATAITPVLGTLALPLAAIGLWAANEQQQQANKIESALRDTRNIRKNFGTAEGQVVGGQQAYENLASGTPVNAKDLQALYTAWSGMGGPALSQFFGTSGGAHGTLPGGPAVAPMAGDTMDALIAQSREAQNKSYWGLLAGLDQAAQSGQPFSELGPMPVTALDALKRGVLGAGITDPSVYQNGPTPTGSLGQMLWGTPSVNGLDQYGNGIQLGGGTAGAAPEAFTQAFTPGNYLNALTQFLQPYNANLGTSQFGQLTAPFQGQSGALTQAQQQNMAAVQALWQQALNAPGRNIALGPDPAQEAYMSGAQTGGGGG